MGEDGFSPNVCYALDLQRGEINKAHQIVTRSTWGSKAPKYRNMELSTSYDGIAIHHIGDWLGRTAKAIEDKHMVENGWDDVGYHYMIHIDGTIYEGRRLTNKGAHLAKYNTGKIGVLMMGDFDHQFWDRDDTLTKKHLAVLTNFIRTLRKHFPIKELGGHEEFPKQKKGCPGNQLLPKVIDLRKTFSLSAP